MNNLKKIYIYIYSREDHKWRKRKRTGRRKGREKRKAKEKGRKEIMFYD